MSYRFQVAVLEVGHPRGVAVTGEAVRQEHGGPVHTQRTAAQGHVRPEADVVPLRGVPANTHGQR